MEIRAQNIVLRDMRAGDIEDEIRWNTVETGWMLWDSPWENDPPFDPEKYRQRQRTRLARPLPDDRDGFEIDTADGVHIGWVNRYCIDEEGNWRPNAPADSRQRRAACRAVGLDLCEPAYWAGGWGAQALAAFVRYLLDSGYARLFTQTWSGNRRMVGLAQKLGFAEYRRRAGARQVRGGRYDALTFRLSEPDFAAFCASPGARVCVCRLEDPAQKEAAAAGVLAALPGWFGLPESTAEYIRTSRELPFWAAYIEGRTAGFAALRQTGPRAAELYVMGVLPQYHRAGAGRRLFGALARFAAQQGNRFLQVKTVRRGCYPEYDRTNAFYQAMGFEELECFPTLWDEHNPCQQLILALREPPG